MSAWTIETSSSLISSGTRRDGHQTRTIRGHIRCPTWRRGALALHLALRHRVKKPRYEHHGLPELWLVDTAATAVLVFRRWASAARAFDVTLELDSDERLTSPLLPDLEIAVGELFPGA